MYILFYSTRYYGWSWYVWVWGAQFVFFKCYMSLDYRQFYDRKLHWTNLDSLIYHLALLQRVAQNLSEWWTDLGYGFQLNEPWIRTGIRLETSKVSCKSISVYLYYISTTPIMKLVFQEIINLKDMTIY